MVFQNYALYPHMTVADNMGFALKIAGVPKDEIRKRVEEAAQILDLDARTSSASRRRSPVASASASPWAAPSSASPQVFLMDEPLSNLDAKLRVQTRTQIASLQRRLGVTTVYVTHDQVEAMTMGDRVAVLKDGLLQQVDTPRRMYDHPNNIFVAGFIGSPAMNLLDSQGGRRWRARSATRSTRCRVRCWPRPRAATSRSACGPRTWTSPTHGIPVRSSWSRSSAPTPTSTARCAPARRTPPIVARVDGRKPPAKGATVHFTPKQGHVHLFDTDTGLRIGD